MTRPKILIVNDCIEDRFWFRRMLTGDDYELHEAHNGAEAITMAQQLAPDVILLDHNMPSVTGLEALREMQRRRIPTRVIVCSTVVNYANEAVAFVRAGAAAVFQLAEYNPVALRELITRVLVLEPTLDELSAPRFVRSIDSAAASLQLSLAKTTNLAQFAMPGVFGATARLPKMFIVHGHDHLLKLELKNYLQNTLKLGEPIVLHEQPSMGRTIIEKFEDEAAATDLVFVLLTPDDALAGNERDNDQLRRARQNVIFEMGYFLGRINRLSGRVILLYKGRLDIPSDIRGMAYIDATNGIERAGEELRRELRQWIQPAD